MVRPSNPRVMQHVLDAVFHLRDVKGLTTHAIQEYVRENGSKGKKLSVLRLEVQRALKHAVNAGLLKEHNGRYKAQLVLKPTRALPSPKTHPAESDDDYDIADEFDLDNQGDVKNLSANVQDRQARRRRRRSSRSRRPRRRQSRRRTKRRSAASSIKLDGKNARAVKAKKPRPSGAGKKPSITRASRRPLTPDALLFPEDVAEELLPPAPSKTNPDPKMTEDNGSDTQSESSTKKQDDVKGKKPTKGKSPEEKMDSDSDDDRSRDAASDSDNSEDETEKTQP